MKNATLLLIFSTFAVPQATAQAAADSEPQAPLVARAESLSKADRHHAAQREIAAALEWTKQAEDAQRVGHQEQLGWLLSRARLQLALAERLVALSKLRHQHRQLTSKTKNLRQGADRQARELEERKAFLQALRDMR